MLFCKIVIVLSYNMAETDIDDVLTLIGFGRIQVLMVFSCGMSGIYVSNEIMGISAMLVSIGCDFSMSTLHLSLIPSAGFLGLVLTSHYWGYQSDLIGRRKVMIFSLFGAMSASLTSIAMPDFYLMLFCRFLVGLLISGVSVIYITYLAEFTNVTMRPRMVNFMSYSFAIAGIYVPFLAHWLEPLNSKLFDLGRFTYTMYRLNMLLNLIPGLLALITICLLPESAKFLLLRGENERAYNTLNRLCRSNRKQDLSTLGVDSIAGIPPVASTMMFSSYNCFRQWLHDTLALFKGPYTRTIFHVTAMLCGFFLVGNGLSLWLMEMRQRFPDSDLIFCQMVRAHSYENTTDQESICSDKPLDYIGGVYMGIALLLGCIAISIMLFWLRRSIILFCNATIAAIGGLSLNFLTNKMAIFIAIVIFVSLCNCSIPLAASVMVDVVPTNIRGKAVSLSYMFARTCVIISINLIGNLMASYCLVIFNVYVVVISISAFLALTLPKSYARD